MRRANGDGTVYKLKGNRRRPWCARKVSSWGPTGSPVYTYIGYYATKKDALTALANFNQKPYDTRSTLGQIYNRWSETEMLDLRENSILAYKTAWNRLKALADVRMADIRLTDLQAIVDPVSKPVGLIIKSLAAHLFKYAVRYEIIPADRYSIVSFVKVSQDRGKVVKRSVFTAEEIQAVTDPLVKILLYTGLRVGELLGLKKSDVHLEGRWLQVRQSKTTAGVRVVPICEKIVECFRFIPADIHYDRFNAVMFKQTGHHPHDTRHTFISRMADLGIDERITKAIVGHAGSGITETVYTHLDLQLLLDAVNKL